MNPLQIILHYRTGLWDGLVATLRLCGIVWSAGLVGGSILGMAAVRWPEEVGGPVRAASFFTASVPVLVLLFWAHYPLQAQLGVVIDPFLTAAAVLSVLNVLGVTQTVREALVEFPRQYLVVARISGLSAWDTLRHIQFPLVVRQILPSLLTSQVGMLQATLFASLISVNELFRVAQHINAEIYEPVQIYGVLAAFFLAICLPLNLCAAWFKQRFTRNVSHYQEGYVGSR